MKRLETLFQISPENNDNTKSRSFPSYGYVRSWKSKGEIKEWNFSFFVSTVVLLNWKNGFWKSVLNFLLFQHIHLQV